MNKKSSHKAAFFDRDGTLIRDVAYLSRLEEVQLLDRALHVGRFCQAQGYRLFVVTNQSGIARGFFDEAFVQATHRFLADCCAINGVHIEKFYFCPHHPTEAVHASYRCDCDCRKPKPGMLLQAAHEFGIDLHQSIMFGDKQTDLDAGMAAGCKTFDITKLFALSLEECAAVLQSLS